MSTAVATVKVHPDEYKKDFEAVVPFLNRYIDKRAPSQSRRLPLLATPDLPSGKRRALMVAIAKERFS